MKFLFLINGTLRLNADRNIVFKPSNQTNYLSSSFGLDSFCIGCSKRNEEPAEIVEEHQLRGL
jgi:hypothetical protein